ncbi:hypothetical protein FRB94_000019 [Tulasnella sp. JGI-2019a]|nr:hypothetical protein FRB94_000019 [Tulasnella sp. JGI-2019a]
MPSDLQVLPPLHEDHESDLPSELDPLLAAGLRTHKTSRPGDLIAAIVTLTSIVVIPTLHQFLRWVLSTDFPLFWIVGRIISLQSTSLENPEGKRKGLAQHQVWQGLLGFPLITLGGLVMVYNKYNHGAPHFTSWHGRFGLLTLILLTIQVLIGGGSVWFGGRVFGGEDRAKAIYKYHRISGYVIVVLLLVTIHLSGGYADWVVGHTSKTERVIFYTVLPVLTLFGIGWRVRYVAMSRDGQIGDAHRAMCTDPQPKQDEVLVIVLSRKQMGQAQTKPRNHFHHQSRMIIVQYIAMHNAHKPSRKNFWERGYQ